jgi:hypothetical protein
MFGFTGLTDVPLILLTPSDCDYQRGFAPKVGNAGLFASAISGVLFATLR